MRDSLTIVSSIRMSPEQQGYKRRARFLFLAASALLIVCLTAAWLMVRSNISKPFSQHVSVLDIEIEGREFSSNATADKLLALADRQCQKILDAYPNLAATYNVKANRNYLTGDLVLAKATWSRALVLDSQSTDAMSWRLEDVIAEVATRFDLVVVDSPAILESPEAQRLAAVLDGAVIVARAGYTHHSKVTAARKLVPKERRLGVVLNESEADAEIAHRRRGKRSLARRLFGRKR